MTILQAPTHKPYNVVTNSYREAGHPEGRHSGLDYGWGDGKQVFSSADGVVIEVYRGGGWNGGWGNRVRIEHNSRFNTAYSHLSSVNVNVGDRVSAGQQLGVMGNTGDAEFEHLHYEAWLDGVRVDPMPYFTQHIPGGTESGKTTHELAQLTIRGAFGNGAARRAALGDQYDAVQDEVNRLLNVPSDVSSLADAVMRGVYGNGAERRAALGDQYDAVQAEVNRRLYG